MAGDGAAESLLEARGLSKAYDGVQALADVTLSLLPGEVHALVGENGAGKSTLIRILAGATLPDAGDVRLAGAAVPLGSVRAAEAAGIAAIHQEGPSFPDMSAADNVFVGHEPRRGLGLLLDRDRMQRETAALLARLGMGHIDPATPLARLPLAARQMVGIARALARDSRVLILDEPTASLSSSEVENLFAVIRDLRSRGVALLYVSHRLDEIFALADRVTVLRDGRVVDTCSVAGVTRDGLIRKMVGRDIASLTGPGMEETAGDTVLEVRDLTLPGAFENVSFTVRAGEIVGLAGLVGAGRSEVARAVFGADRPQSGGVRVDGVPITPGNMTEAIRCGIALVPEDRQAVGLVLPLSVHDNLILAVLRELAHGVVRSRRREAEVVNGLMKDLGVRAASTALPAAALSGGNQQKLVIGKWLAAKPRVLLLDEPTRGVDVGAKAEIYRLIRRLAEGGMATLLISSDLPELLAISDRILVMRRGRIVGELSGRVPRHSPGGATEERVLSLALGEPAATSGGIA
jgi:rhamnose transport system ATP-binding protein